GAMLAAPTSVQLLVGRSTIIDIGSTIARVSLTVPDVADAMVTAPTQLLIHGKQPGTISMFVWDRMGAITTYEVVVRRDLSALLEQVKNLFPGEPITIAGSGKDVVISGTVSSKYVIDKAADVAAGYVEKKENVVNLLKQAEGVASNQVMLKVRFAEVSRNALQELGASLFSDGNNNMFGRTATQQFAAPFFDKNQPSAALGETLVFSDYLNLFLFDAKNKIGAVVKALSAKGVFQSLAEPNLIALNGKEASFLAGGEFPYPVPQGALGSFTIHFKEYGVRLSFTPTVLGGDLINLKIKPEVSSLDFNNAVVIEGFRIPALTSRRAETEVELQDGQTFAIAGLLNNTALSSMRKIPILGDIPVLGTLFKSRAYQKDQTELVVMVTPTIVRRGSTGVSSGIPSLVEPFLGPNEKPIAPPAPYVGSPLYPVNPSAVPVPATRPAPTASAMPANGTAPVQDPIASTPIQSPAAMPPAKSTAPVMTEKERKAFEAEQERQAKAAAAEEQRQADADKIAAKKADEDRKKAEKTEKERARKQAELDKKAADEAEKAAIKKAEEDRRKNAEEEKRNKSVAEAAARLKQAQEAYQAEVSRTAKGGVK
ncbi:MAG: pilus assembly protein N-terminal domain-containing protein, partial [Acidobacteriota bacterium]|nr:pilus assembly protein N-terminal domain-containing protein [Acidobacteriota bacterium]